MKVWYWYKDKAFEDIRDITLNNRLKPDWNYIFEEYLPYQVFISGRTFFEDLKIYAAPLWRPGLKFEEPKSFSRELFSESIERYMWENREDEGRVIAAVSGGVDSSAVALEIKPELIYTGYYDDPAYDETPYSKAVAQEIRSLYYAYKLTEQDFLDNLTDYVEVIGVPAGGLGGVMELSLLRKVLVDVPDTKYVLFGNGGDEIFMGYFYNHYVKNFIRMSQTEDEYMPNFLPSKIGLADKLLDFIIVASINRSSLDSLFTRFSIDFINRLKKYETYLEKMLYININITLPTLLHLNQQICKANGVKGLNPLSNYQLISVAEVVNTPMSDIPKEKLRKIHPNMPRIIVENRNKNGFPIPLHKWKEAAKFIGVLYNKFFERKEVKSGLGEPKPYRGINRYSWAVALSELTLQKQGL